MNLRGLLRIAIAWPLCSLTNAWSAPRQCGRKDFLRDAAASSATFLGTVAVTGNAAPAQAAAQAAPNRPGKKNAKVYTPEPDSLRGKAIVITGASTGLGLESAKRLAAAGATVVMTARTAEKGVRAIDQVKAYLAERSIVNRSVYFIKLDLDDLDSVKTFPERYSELLGSRKISILMNNAGVAAIPQRETTRDGFERTFQSNHLGPFVLTAKLFPYLDRNGARVINVSSVAHSLASTSGKQGLDMENLNGELEYKGSGWQAYGLSKLENILFTQELQRRVDSKGFEWLSTFSLHPGAVGTDIWRSTYVGTTGSSQDSFSAQRLASDLFYGSILTTEEGANTQVFLSALGENEARKMKGLYFDEYRRPAKLERFAQDATKAKLLWERSESLTGVDFKIE